MLLEKFELGSEPMLKDVKTVTQQAVTRHAQSAQASRTCIGVAHDALWYARRVNLLSWRNDMTFVTEMMRARRRHLW